MKKTYTLHDFASNLKAKRQIKCIPYNARIAGVGLLVDRRVDLELLYLRPNGRPSRYSSTLSRIFQYDVVKIDSLVLHYVRTFEHLSLHHGEIYAIKRMKRYLSSAERYASQVTDSRMRFVCLDEDMVPKFLWEFKTLLSGTFNEKQLALTILNLGRLYVCRPTTYDTSSVTAQPPIFYKGDHSPGSYFRQFSTYGISMPKFAKCWEETLRELFPKRYIRGRINLVKKTRRNIHISGRNGPNGHSIAGAGRDMIALLADKENGGSILSNIRKLSVGLGNKTLNIHTTDYETDPDFLEMRDSRAADGKDSYHSCLNLKQGEPWWKERVFASGDFFTQSALIGLQTYLRQYLGVKRWSFDGSANQQQAIDQCREWTKTSFPYSKDLTTATDSIPIDLLGELCVAIIGTDLGNAWVSLMRDRDFYDKIGDRYLRYNTGNPMGFYTSWYLMHFMQIALYLSIEKYLSLPDSRKLSNPAFVVVGDDSATRSKAISKIYDIVMSNVLGVAQSKYKGYSRDVSLGENLYVCEICKRIMMNGVDISPISPRVILDGLSDPCSFPNLIFHIQNRRVEESPSPTVIANYILPDCIHQFKSIRTIYNPVVCPEGLDELDIGTIRDKQCEKEVTEFIERNASVPSDKFYSSLLYHSTLELFDVKVKIGSWVRDSYIMSFLPTDLAKPLRKISQFADYEAQEVLQDLVLENLVGDIIDRDCDLFPVMYKDSMLTRPPPIMAREVWTAVKDMFILDGFPAFLGYARLKRDETGRNFGQRLYKLFDKVTSSVEDDNMILEQFVVLEQLQLVIETPILDFAKSEGERDQLLKALQGVKTESEISSEVSNEVAGGN